MIADLQPYPAMKESGVEWLGEVPKEWEVRRNGRLFAQRNETGFAELPILEVSLRTGVRVRDFANSDRKQVMSDREKYKRALAGDIAYNTMRMWQGAVGVAPADGLISPAYVIARPLPGTNSRYFERLFRTPAYMQEVDNYSRGIVKDRNRLYWEDFKAIPSCYPPPKEQAAIVRYLDHVDRRVRRLVRAKRKMIALLTERKQAITYRAVTRGLDPGVPLKGSGIEWLGKVPCHWEVRRLKQAFCRIVGGSTPSSAEPANWDGDVVWVTPADVSGTTRLKNSLRRLTRDGLKSCSSELVPPGSIVVTSRAPVGNVAIAETDLCTNQGCKALVATPEVIDPLYGLNVLAVLKDESQSLAVGTTFTEISTNRLGSVAIPLPPVSEQAAIVEFLGKAAASIDVAGSRATREIELLDEFRARLVADVVTGKLDVREAAAALPERDSLEAEDELEPFDAVTEVELDDLDAIPEEAEG